MPGNDIWTEPRDWVANEIVTDAMLNQQVRDNLIHLKAHLETADEVHGLPASAYPLGTTLGAGRFLQFATGTLAYSTPGWVTINFTWPVAFSTVVDTVMQPDGISSSTYFQHAGGASYSVTGGSYTGYCNGNAGTVKVHAIGIGT